MAVEKQAGSPRAKTSRRKLIKKLGGAPPGARMAYLGAVSLEAAAEFARRVEE